MSLKHARATVIVVEEKKGYKCTLLPCPLCKQVTFMGIIYCCDQKNTKSPRCAVDLPTASCLENGKGGILCSNPVTGALGLEAKNSECREGVGCVFGTYTGKNCLDRFGTIFGCPNP
jgi:hypothetical protein